MQLSGDLAMVVLRDRYGSSLDWEMWRTPRRSDSAFISSAWTCFPKVQRFFKPQLVDGETFRFWFDNGAGTQKLTGLRLHLLSQRRQIWADPTKARDAGLACIQALDVMEDSRPLTAVQACERMTCCEDVAEADLKFKMDWRQRSRQLWLAARDANTKFFHQAENGRGRSNGIGRL